MSSNYQIKKGIVGGYKISYNCPHCSTGLKSALDEAGKTEPCPECGRPFVVPGAADRERILQGEALAAEAKRNEQLKTAQERQARRDAAQKQAEKAKMVPGDAFAPLDPATDSRPCPYCGERILAVAKKCKHCGEFLTGTLREEAKGAATPQTGKGTSLVGVGCLSMFGLFGLLFMICSPTSSVGPTNSGSSSALDDKISAWTMAEEFVKKQLKSPGTADFGGFSDYQDPRTQVTVLGGGKYKVVGWVDAQNAFGATLRNDFVCELEYVGNDQWRCTNILLLPR